MSKSIPGTTIIQSLRKGHCNEEIGDAIAQVVDRVKATGKPGEVIIKLKIKPAGIEEGAKDTEVERTWVDDTVTVKLPALPKQSTMFFIEPDTSNLTRNDPAQHIPGIKQSA